MNSENRELNILNENELYEIDGEIYSLHEIKGFIESAKQLGRKTRFINALKLQNQELTKERNNLVTELNNIKAMSMFEFGNTYASKESLEADGHAFAKALLGGI